MAKNPALIAPRLPRGFEDRAAADIAATDAMIGKIREVFERYGFDPVETPAFEFTETLGKFLPDEDRPNQGVFSLQDDDEQWLSLRYDLTAPLARHFAENFETLPKPYRTYRQGYVFRNEKPGPGRFRQFMQFDADTVGAAGPEADAEMCMMMADTMDALGLQGKYVVKIGSRKVLDALMLAVGLGGDENAGRRLTAMRSIDKLDRLGFEGVSLLLGVLGRLDRSGDKTPGLGLADDVVKRILDFLRPVWGSEQVVPSVDRPWEDMAETEGGKVLDNYGTLIHWESVVGSTDIGAQAISDLRSLLNICESSGFGSKRLRIDSSVVRGLEYYTGPVFEIELTFPITNEKGQEVEFGSVGGGGRYDGLVSRFRKEPVPATGFSIGVSRLMSALKLTGNLAASDPLGPVVVCVMDKDQKAGYQKMVAELRAKGIRAEMYLGNPKNIGKQFAYADQRNSPAVVIEGTQEREKGIVQIKDLIAGKEKSASITGNAEWKAERPGQFECDRSEMVEKIAELPAVKAWLDKRK